jgi:uncharacterized protein DUF402
MTRKRLLRRKSGPLEVTADKGLAGESADNVLREFWRPGDVILMEEFLARARLPQLISVRTQVVVQDSQQFLAIASLPGATWMTRDEPGRNAMTIEERIALYLKEELPHAWYERTIVAPTLTLHLPGEAYSIRLFWQSDWQLRFWYVNLEEPYTRTDRGIQVTDHTLDLVITPDFQWSWKDEPEFDALTKAGKIPVAKARAIRSAGEQAIRRLEARQWPFNEPWPDWRPDPSWVAPKIADYWTTPVEINRPAFP